MIGLEDIKNARGTHSLEAWAARCSAAAPAALVVFGCAVMALALVGDFLGVSRPGVGWKQSAVLASGASVAVGGMVLSIVSAQRTLSETLRFAATAGLVGLVALAINLYDIENIGFSKYLAALIFCGFVANHYLPASARPIFFLVLSIAGIAGILHLANTLIIVGVGAVMIGLCHLKAPIGVRVALLLLVAAVLTALRLDRIATDWSGAVLPILASMFMFRLSIYLYDVASGKGPTGWAQRFAYFFMLPNAAFPFFPVVDYATFGRNYLNEEALRIYERGASWMLRGLIHLLLYRVVSYYLVTDPAAVDGPSDFFYYAVTNFFLYLKVSGLFHLIVGVLLIFGFNLPETHTRYYFSNGFIDFWRRINIYWKDYMQKMVFTPCFLALKRRGLAQDSAILLAMLVVFFVTWALHAYQWFWIRGDVHFSGPDAFFWGFLAVMLVAQTAYETQLSPGSRAPAGRYLLNLRSMVVLRTSATMLTIFVLWSLWTSATIAEWFALVDRGGFPTLSDGATPAELLVAATILAASALVLGLALGVTFGLGPHASRAPRARKPAAPGDDRFYGRTAARLALAGAVLALQAPALTAPFGAGVEKFAFDLATSKLNARDAAALERGYYEGLTDVNRFNTELWQLYAKRPTGWVDIRETDAARETGDYRQYDLKPSVSIIYKGAPFQTNRWAMRDKHYSFAKPEGIYRIALIGDSRSMGYGIADPDTFETKFESRLNTEYGSRFEVLNFGVADYKPVQRLMALEHKALAFRPDAFIFTGHFDDFELRHLAEAVKRGVRLPYAELESIVAASGATRQMEMNEIRRRVDAYETQVVAAVYRRVVDIAKRENILPIWMYLPSVKKYARDEQSKYEKLKEIATAAGFIIVDLYGMFDGEDLTKLWVAEWDTHPNALGNQLIADHMLDGFRANSTIAEAMKLTPPSQGPAISQ